MSLRVNYPCLTLILLATCCASQRTLKTFLNPGCDDICTVQNVTTFYLRAEGPRDTLHYIWDFYGNPSLLLAITSPSAQLRVLWNDYLLNRPQSISFTEQPKYTFGMVIQKLIEFNDINDTALLGDINPANINILNTKMFNWVRNGLWNNTEYVELQMAGGEYRDHATGATRKGNIEIILNGFCNLEHSDVMPHMLHSENSTQIDIILNHLETNSSFGSSRFALELLLVSESRDKVGMSIDSKKNLDDEHTPGIFEVVELRTPRAKLEDDDESSAYLQWKPISYVAPARRTNETTESVYYPLINITNPTYVAKDSLLYAYYGAEISHLLVEKINISLGMRGDGFYKKTNYTTWTFLVGYGIPPAERFSYLVIMILSIGIGLPLVILLIVGIYYWARRIPKRTEDLFINS